MLTEDILKWVKTLPKWQQILSYMIIEKTPINEDAINGVYDVFKVEMSLEDGIVPENIVEIDIDDSDNSPDIYGKVWEIYMV